MTIDPIQLLKKLEPPVRPVGFDRSSPGTPPLEQRGFDELLSLVSTGDVRSGRDLEVPGELEETLDPDQLDRLAAAADLAESAGARRVVMLMDGRGLVVDIPTRHVEQELTSSPRPSVVELDAAVYVAGAEADDALRDPLPPPASGLPPPGVLRQLEVEPRSARHAG